MNDIKVKIIEPIGLHARPASIAVRIASKFESEISIVYGEENVNMKSIMGVLSLGIPTGGELVITADGQDEVEALEKIVEVLKTHNIIE